jgi:hypothetical protein
MHSRNHIHLYLYLHLHHTDKDVRRSTRACMPGGCSQLPQVGPVDGRRQRRCAGALRAPARMRPPSGFGPPLRAPPVGSGRPRRAARAWLGRPRPAALHCGQAPSTAAQHRHSHARRRRAARTHRVSRSVHLPSDSGSAVTFVPAMRLPCMSTDTLARAHTHTRTRTNIVRYNKI